MTLVDQDVQVHQPDGAVIHGTFDAPDDVAGVVVFAHGSGSSRHSPRNRRVARALQQAGLATLLVDLLTAAEDEEDQVTRRLRFDIALLAERLAGTAAWLGSQAEHRSRPIGYFGASTGAAAALVAAARHPRAIGAIVSRGGRPDLAGEHLTHVHAPTLLIVGGRDDVVIDLNRQAYDQLPGERHLEIVPGATHLFEEPGALEQVAGLAADWFARHLHEPISQLPPGSRR